MARGETLVVACQMYPLHLIIKFNCAQVYDKVRWNSLLRAMLKMDIVRDFVEMMKLLFKEAKFVVCLNGAITRPFETGRGIDARVSSCSLPICHCGKGLECHG